MTESKSNEWSSFCCKIELRACFGDDQSSDERFLTPD